MCTTSPPRRVIRSCAGLALAAYCIVAAAHADAQHLAQLPAVPAPPVPAQPPAPPPALPPAPSPAAPIVQGKDLDEVQNGWSALDQLVGSDVRNDAGQTIGTIEDLFVLPKTGVAFAIIEVGAFVGSEGKLVVAPVSRLTLSGDAMILKGASKEFLKNAPPFAFPE